MKLGQYEMVLDGKTLLIHEPPRKTRLIAYSGMVLLIVLISMIIVRHYPDVNAMISPNLILYFVWAVWGIWEI